jgi:antitoxin PrlF
MVVLNGSADVLDKRSRNSYRSRMKATVSEKGQVTIPKALRTKLGIGPGAVLEFEEDRGRLIGRKASQRNPVDEVWARWIWRNPWTPSYLASEAAE